MLAGAAQGKAGGVDSLDRPHGIALDAGHLHLAAHRIAGEPQVVLHAYFGGVFDNRRAATQDLGQRPRGHGAGHPHFPLAAHFRPREGGVFLVEDADGGGGEEVAQQQFVIHLAHEAIVIVQHGGNDAGGTVGGGGHHPAAGGILLVDGQREQIHPLHHHQRILVEIGLAAELAIEGRRPPFHLEPAGQHPLAATATLDAALHRLPDLAQARLDLGLRAKHLLVGQHQAGDGEAALLAVGQQLGAALERVGNGVGRIEAGGLLLGVGEVALLDDEAATDGVVGLLEQQLFTGEGAQGHAVGVGGQGLAPVEDDGAAAGELAGLLPRQPQRLAALHLGQEGGNGLDVHRLGFKTGQPQDDGLAGAMALAGLAEGAVALHFYPFGPGQQPLLLECDDKGVRGAHRPHGMRRRGTDPDGKQVEDTDHDTTPIMGFV